MVRDTCSICGTEFAVVLDEMNWTGKHMLLPGNLPLRVRHHESGNYVDVFGTLKAFYEIVDGKLVEANPVLCDVLEG